MSRALRYTPLVEVPKGKCTGLPNDAFQIQNGGKELPLK